MKDPLEEKIRQILLRTHPSDRDRVKHDIIAKLRRARFRPVGGKTGERPVAASETAEADINRRVIQKARELRIAWRDKITWLKDLNGRYLFYSAPPGLATISPEEHIGRTDLEIFPGETGEAYRKNDRIIIESNMGMDFKQIASKTRTSIVRKFPVHDRGGHPIAVGAIVLSLSDAADLMCPYCEIPPPHKNCPWLAYCDLFIGKNTTAPIKRLIAGFAIAAVISFCMPHQLAEKVYTRFKRDAIELRHYKEQPKPFRTKLASEKFLTA